MYGRTASFAATLGLVGCVSVSAVAQQVFPGPSTGSGSGVSSFSAGTLGLNPSTPTTGAITLSGILGVANGGTGISTLATTGIPQISSGTWSVSMTLPSGLTIPAPTFTGTATFADSSTIGASGTSGTAINNSSIGATTASTGAFTTLSASSTVSGTGFSAYLASPPAIGATAAAAITGTNITATTQFLGPNGSLTNPSFAFTSQTNTGFWLPAAGEVELAVAGVKIWDYAVTTASTTTIQGGLTTAGGNIISSSSLQVGGSSTISWNGRGILSSPSTATIHFGAGDTVSPVAQTIGVQGVGAGTANTAGANWTINGSVGTGTGAGGSIIFQTAPAGSPGSTQNALATVLTLDSSKRAIFTGSIDFGGTTSSFPALTVSGTTLKAQLADGSADAPFTAAAATFSGNITMASSTTGTGAQTFTNSPCTGLMTERWVPIGITGQSGTWYMPACQ